MNDLGNKEIFAKNLKYYMDFEKKDRNKICNDLHIPYTTFTDWVNGVAYPRIDKIELLANYFGIKKSDLIEGKNDILFTIDNETKLTKEIEFLAKNDVEKELLIKATMLDVENQSKLLELTDLYLKFQSDYCIQEEKGK